MRSHTHQPQTASFFQHNSLSTTLLPRYPAHHPAHLHKMIRTDKHLAVKQVSACTYKQLSPHLDLKTHITVQTMCARFTFKLDLHNFSGIAPSTLEPLSKTNFKCLLQDTKGPREPSLGLITAQTSCVWLDKGPAVVLILNIGFKMTIQTLVLGQQARIHGWMLKNG